MMKSRFREVVGIIFSDDIRLNSSQWKSAFSVVNEQWNRSSVKSILTAADVALLSFLSENNLSCRREWGADRFD